MLRDGTAGPATNGDGHENMGDAVKPSRPEDEVLQHRFWLATLDPPRSVSLPGWILDLLSEANEILVLAQVNYWFRVDAEGRLRAGVRLGGHVWVAKTYRDLGVEIHRAPRQVKKAVKGLVAKGYLVVERHCSKFYGGNCVTHFRPNWDKIAADHQAAVHKTAENQAQDREDLP